MATKLADSVLKKILWARLPRTHCKNTRKTRDSRLKKIGAALELAVPQFKELRFAPDKINGRPHLEAKYSHYRPNAGWQREEQFSDGTLRLLALLWVLLEGDSLLLLEEPELSLNDAIVRRFLDCCTAFNEIENADRDKC